MNMLKASPSPATVNSGSNRISSLLPAAMSNLFLTTCLLDRSKRELAATGRPCASLDACRKSLNEIRRIWGSCIENERGVTVAAAYKIYVVINTIERVMNQLPPESVTYARLQRCVNLLDEVDFVFETSAVQLGALS
jgi:hypothetical protein